ncbi:MAG: hypothetical protein H0W81_04840 [Chloroflexi bacterium]|nr:hypothetical protein [Chloroflexota bacterium]
MTKRTSRPIVGYTTPSAHCPDEMPGILFKSGHLEGNRLYVPTQTEILIYSVPAFELVTVVSLPFFNDLHHVRPSRSDGLIVTVTGLDLVVELGFDGALRNEWSATSEDPWQRFSRDTDYRKYRTTKPHLAHPNFTFYLGDELWTTRFEQRDAISLTRLGRSIELGGERVHDGVVDDERIYFTHVDGKVSIAGCGSLRVEDRIDLADFYDHDSLLGWTRGIAVDGPGVWIGFTRVRKTRFRENVAWVKGRRSLPTRVAYFDLASRRLGPTIELERSGMNALFSVLVR